MNCCSALIGIYCDSFLCSYSSFWSDCSTHYEKSPFVSKSSLLYIVFSTNLISCRNTWIFSALLKPLLSDLPLSSQNIHFLSILFCFILPNFPFFPTSYLQSELTLRMNAVREGTLKNSQRVAWKSCQVDLSAANTRYFAIFFRHKIHFDLHER